MHLYTSATKTTFDSDTIFKEIFPSTLKQAGEKFFFEFYVNTRLN